MAARTGSINVGFPPNWAARIGWMVFALYIAYAASHLELTPARFIAGLEHGGKFVARLFPPDFHRWELLMKGMIESLQMAVLASTLGVLVSAPLALCAA